MSDNVRNSIPFTIGVLQGLRDMLDTPEVKLMATFTDYERQALEDAVEVLGLLEQFGGVPTVHEVKTLPEYFRLAKEGLKPFELRLDDRGYKQGDILVQREWSPESGFTGESIRQRITYVLSDEQFCKEDYVALGTSNF